MAQPAPLQTPAMCPSSASKSPYSALALSRRLQGRPSISATLSCWASLCSTVVFMAHRLRSTHLSHGFGEQGGVGYQITHAMGVVFVERVAFAPGTYRLGIHFGNFGANAPCHLKR
jgi:hypothetical protein